MKIRSPPNLHYPITVVELAQKTQDEVQRSSPLFHYTYQSVVTEGDRYGEEKQVTKSFPARFDSSTDGTISRWFIKKGTVVHRPGTDIVEIEEPCTHEIQFGGLCANCGKDMAEVDYLTEERNVDRATINMTHDNVALLVSQKEAARAEEGVKKRLLGAKKLSLIVDLDQTVIHTTCERTIAEWQADPENPNYEAVKDVRSFQLADDNVAHVAANWYYVKMRPGLKDFFDRLSTMYEMHIYTMATRAYAQAVAQIIDPERKYFGDRILSRDENGTDREKKLKRLFPTNTNMVVIIDDRADIWHYSDNLVRVPVFNFFPGAGDINASFLPKQQELVTTVVKSVVPEPSPAKEDSDKEIDSTTVSVAGKPTETVPVEASNGELTDLGQQLVSMGAGETQEDLEQHVKEQEKVIETQLTERPLLHKQLLLDQEDEAADAVAEVTDENGDAQHSEQHKHRHSLLHNDDQGLNIIEQNLRRVHRAFYDEYTREKKKAQGGRVAELRGSKSPRKRVPEEYVPDVGVLMPEIKQEILGGCVVVFSGIIPLGMDVQASDFALWIKSFGAEVSLNVTRRTTHVIANPDRKTTKVKQAARYPHIKIVNAEWMFQCCTVWHRVDESPYIIETDSTDRNGSPFEELVDEDLGAVDEEGVLEDGLPDDVHQGFADISTERWAEIGNEIDDILADMSGDETSASDSESVQSDASALTDTKPIKRKRKRGDTGSTDNSDAEESDSSVNSASKLQKRKKRTLERVTSLTNVVTADKSSGLPSPETTGPEEEQGDDEKDPGPAGLLEDDSDDDGLAADLMAELDRELSAE